MSISVEEAVLLKSSSLRRVIVFTEAGEWGYLDLHKDMKIYEAVHEVIKQKKQDFSSLGGVANSLHVIYPSVPKQKGKEWAATTLTGLGGAGLVVVRAVNVDVRADVNSASSSSSSSLSSEQYSVIKGAGKKLFIGTLASHTASAEYDTTKPVEEVLVDLKESIKKQGNVAEDTPLSFAGCVYPPLENLDKLSEVDGDVAVLAFRLSTSNSAPSSMTEPGVEQSAAAIRSSPSPPLKVEALSPALQLLVVRQDLDDTELKICTLSAKLTLKQSVISQQMKKIQELSDQLKAESSEKAADVEAKLAQCQTKLEATTAKKGILERANGEAIAHRESLFIRMDELIKRKEQDKKESIAEIRRVHDEVRQLREDNTKLREDNIRFQSRLDDIKLHLDEQKSRKPFSTFAESERERVFRDGADFLKKSDKEN